MRAAILLSGGMDSATLFYYLYKVMAYKDDEIDALAFAYGQRHSQRETHAASMLVSGVCRLHILSVNLEQLGESALTGTLPVPGQEQNAQSLTVVPGRNAVLLSMAAGWAAAHGVHVVYFAPVVDDYRTYPDCRPDFVHHISAALSFGYGVQVIAPLGHLTKAEMVELGLRLEVPYSKTYTCYKGDRLPCMECDACAERMAAMQANGRDYYGNSG